MGCVVPNRFSPQEQEFPGLRGDKQPDRGGLPIPVAVRWAYLWTLTEETHLLNGKLFQMITKVHSSRSITNKFR